MTSPLKGNPAKRGKRVSEKAFAAMWFDPEITVREIGKVLGVTDSAARARAKARGMPTRFEAKTYAIPRKVSRAQEPLFTAMYRANVSTIEMARHFGIWYPSVAQVAKRLGIANRGKLHPNQSITVAQFQQGLLAKSMAKTALRETKRAKSEGIIGRASPAPQIPKPLLLEHRIAL